MNNIFKFSSIGLCLWLAGHNVFAVDFIQAYELAKKNDPEIMVASFEYQVALSDRPQIRSALLPTLKLDVYSQLVEQESNSLTNPVNDYDANGYTLSLTQSIYNHDLYLKLEQTDISIASATVNYDAAKQALIVRVAEAYYGVLAADDNLVFTQAEKKAISKQLEQARKRFEVGMIAITDVKESQAQYDLSVASEIQAENLLSTTRETLRSIIGELPESLSVLTKEIPLIIPEPANINQWVDAAKKSNLTLKSAQYAFDIANKQVSINRSGHYPSLNLSLMHGDINQDIDNSANVDSEDTTISLNLSIPIYSGGLTSAKTRTAILQKERSRALREKALRDTIKLSRDSYLSVKTNIAQVKAFKQALISTQSAYETTLAGFDVGSRTSVEVLSVLREQYRAERDYASARYDYILSILKLKQAAGILAEQDVMQVNQWLQH
jgi:outer membrane protein